MINSTHYELLKSNTSNLIDSNIEHIKKLPLWVEPMKQIANGTIDYKGVQKLNRALQDTCMIAGLNAVAAIPGAMFVLKDVIEQTKRTSLFELPDTVVKSFDIE